MRQYYCTNGEIVHVEDHPLDHNKIFVYYQGKRYEIPRSIIGKKLFIAYDQSKNKNIEPVVTKVNKRENIIKVDHNSVVELKNLINNTSMVLKMVPTESKMIYLQAGGAYRRPLVEYKNIPIVDFDTTSDSIYDFEITEHSPIGKCLMGKTTGEVIVVDTPNGAKDKYEILSIVNKK